LSASLSEKKPAVRWSIKLKVMTSLTLLMISLISLLTFIHLSSQKQMLENELQKRISTMKKNLIGRGKSFISSLAGQVENEIAAYNFSAVMEIAKKAVSANQDIKYAVLTDASGLIFMHTLKPELIQTHLSGQISLEAIRQMKLVIAEYKEGEEAVVKISAPLQVSTTPWGEIQLVYTFKYLEKEIHTSREQIRKEIRKFIVTTTLTSLGFVLLSIFLVYFFTSRLLSPVIELTHFARKLSDGDFSSADEIEIRSKDEVGLLASAFADMKKDLRVSYEKLAESNRTLEQKVRERTAALDMRNQELNKASLTKSQFIANISHEIKTPMNAIIGMTDLVLKMELQPKIKAYLNTVKTSANTLMDLFSDILDFSKIEAGKVTLEKVKFSLTGLLNGLIDTFVIKIADKGIEMIVHVERDVPDTLIGDPLRLGQVMANLVGNGIKFTEKGEIHIHVGLVSKKENSVQLHFSIRDTGIGIQPYQIPLLFDSFTQADGSTTRKYGGSGLGLTISRQLVDLMSGELAAESTPGHGSTFTFTASFDIPSDEITEEKPEIPETLHGTHILVVEKNATSREMICRLLSESALAVTAADSAGAALDRLKSMDHKKPYRLMIIDSTMVKSNGMNLFERLKTEKVYSEMFVVLLKTMGREDADLFHGFEDALVSKPVKQNELLPIVRSVLSYRGKKIIDSENKIRISDIKMNTDGFQKKSADNYAPFLQKLSELILENNLQAKEYLESIRFNLGEIGSSDEFRLLANQVSRFEFKNARATLNNIASIYGIILRGEKP